MDLNVFPFFRMSICSSKRKIVILSSKKKSILKPYLLPVKDERLMTIV